MKKILTVLTTALFTAIAFAQVPQKMSYQAVIRNSSNALVVTSTVGMRISILQGSVTGSTVYTETQTTTTNANGLVSIDIGGGVGFSTIDWTSGPYFIKTETDPTGGTNYTITGISQLLSVPYALYAKTSGSSLPGPKGDKGDTGLNGADGLTTSVNGVTQVNGAITLTKANIDLANVDNTNDVDKPISTATQSALDNKVDKVANKGLSTNDYTTNEKTKLAGIADGAQVNVKPDWNAATGNVAEILNKPTLFSGSYTDLTSKPTNIDEDKTDDVTVTGDQTIDGYKYFTSLVRANSTMQVSETVTNKSLFLRQDGSHSYISNKANFLGMGSSTNGILFLNGESGIRFNYGAASSIGTTAMALNNAGNIGINTYSPASRLHVYDTIGINQNDISNLLYLHSYKGNNMYLQFYALRKAAGANWFDVSYRIQHRVDGTNMGYIEFNSGNNAKDVAIGTNSTARLTIQYNGNINANNNSITNVSTPVNATDATNKAYVDALKQQIKVLEDNLINAGTYKLEDVDGNQYNVIRIGTQVWMAENLKTTKYRDGTAIPNVTVNAAWAALNTGAYCDYSNTPSNSTTYGKLYNYYTVVDTRNLCPAGWHIPTDAEWTTLTNYLGGLLVAGGKLKEIGYIHWRSPNADATNEFGFTALPAGYRDDTGAFTGINDNVHWWSTTEYSTIEAYGRGIYYTSGEALSYYYTKGLGFSVRCVRN